MIVVELARRSVVRKAETGPQTRVLERNAYGLENGYIGIQRVAAILWLPTQRRRLDVGVFRMAVPSWVNSP
jgi:hypothetical protein